MSVAVVALAAIACSVLGAWWLADPAGWLHRYADHARLFPSLVRRLCAPNRFNLALTRLCGTLLIAAGGAVLALLFTPPPG
jgi:hypothetical protein